MKLNEKNLKRVMAKANLIKYQYVIENKHIDIWNYFYMNDNVDREIECECILKRDDRLTPYDLSRNIYLFKANNKTQAIKLVARINEKEIKLYK